MRILYIALSCGPNLGSEDAVGWNVPNEMMQLGHDVTVLTRSDKKNEIEDYIRAHPKESYPVFIYRPLSVLAKICKGPFYSVRAKMWCKAVSKEIASLCERAPYDVVHQITPVEYRAIVDFSSVSGLRVAGPFGGGGEIDPVLWHAYLRPKDRLIENFRAVLNKISINSVSQKRALLSHDVVLAANRETERILRTMGWNKDIFVQSEVAVKQISANRHRSHSKIVIGSAGRLQYRKGYLFLLDVLKKLECDNWECLIAGDGPQRRRIETAIGEKGLANHVRLLGQLDYAQMEDFYQNLDLFVFPSFREATGTVLVEALAAGVPALSFDSFGAHEILADVPEALINMENCDLEELIERFAIGIQSAFPEHAEGYYFPQRFAKTWKNYVIDLEKMYKTSVNVRV